MPPVSPADDKVVVGNGEIDITNATLATEVTPDATADSSTATDAKPQSALDVVKAALKDSSEETKTGAEATAEASSAEEAGNQKAATSNDNNQEVDEAAEDAKLPFHNHPRWKAVTAERDQYREMATELKQRADVFDRLAAATQEVGLSGDEFDTGFEIMRLMKTNPLEAWQKLQPFVQELQMMVGEQLPDDLQEKVESGVIDEATAKEIAILRTTNAIGKQNQALTVKQIEEQQAKAQQTRDEQINAQMGTTITTWENNWKKSDPDYQIKQPLVQARIIELMNQHGKPRTPADAVLLANHAKNDVEKIVGKIMPRKASVTTVTGGQSNSNGTPVAKTAKDVVSLALEGKYQPIT